jgi:PAS domain S-box-containing protein
MWDIATPIKINNKHVGNIFLGQFLYDDESVDEEFFIEQAKKYSFNEEEYIKALHKVPRWSRTKVESVMRFYAKLAQMISNLSHSTLTLSDALEEKKELSEKLEKAKNEAEKEECKFRSYIENSPDGIFVADENGRYLEVNRAAEKITGYTKNELLNLSINEILASESKEKGIKAFNEIKEKGASSVEVLYIHKDKSKRWWSVNSSKLSENRYLGFVRDTTDKKLFETYNELSIQILSELNTPKGLKDTLQSILTLIKNETKADAVGIRLKKEEDYPYFVQNGFSDSFLLQENSILERYPKEHVCKNTDGKVSLECTCGLVISGKTDPSSPLFTQSGSSWTNDSYQVLDLTPEEDPRHHPRNNCIDRNYASIALIPIKNKSTIIGLLQINAFKKGLFSLTSINLLEGIAAHIGERIYRKKIEDELNKSAQKLMQSSKLAAIGELAAGVGHEVNNPLAIISGHVESLSYKLADNPKFSQSFSVINNCIDRIREIVSGLRTFAAGNTEYIESIDINETIKNSLSLVKTIYSKENILIQTSLVNETLFTKGNRGKLCQVILNLLSNAKDALLPEGGKIEIETKKTDEKAILIISDNGRGIKKEDINKVFDSFYTTKEVGKGVGLGLSISHSIITSMEGEIEVESILDKGTKFTISMPLAYIP